MMINNCDILVTIIIQTIYCNVTNILEKYNIMSRWCVSVDLNGVRLGIGNIYLVTTGLVKFRV